MQRQRESLIRRVAAVAALATSLTAGVWIGSVMATAPRGSTPAADVPRDVQAPAADVVPMRTGFGPIVRAALPAVVNISTTRIVDMPAQPLPFPSDPFFRDFFGWEFDAPRERRERGLGSGVILQEAGHVLTNDHVVRDATEIVVSLADGRELRAALIGRDPKSDIAVLRIEADGLPSLPLGDSTAVEVGDLVLAMGNAFGIGQTVTMGIVSATGRGGLDIEAYEDFIQTDAAINPGNSGGPLVNLRGEVIGINTAIISRTGGNQGVGFAVPSDMARDVMTQLIEHGRVSRGWLGVGIQPVSPAIARAFDREHAAGALVGFVEPGGPADRAGLLTGDIIVELDGHEIEDARSFRLEVARTPPGTAVRLGIVRDGDRLTVPVTLGTLADELPATAPAAPAAGAFEGVRVDDLTPDIARRLGLPRNTSGVVVTDVSPSSAAAAAGLRRGDVIQEVNRERVASLAAFDRETGRLRDGTVLLLVNRNGRTLYVVVD